VGLHINREKFMRKLLVLAPCTALLFACGGGGAGSVALQPGQWETAIQFTNIEVPGVPEAQVAAMRSAMSRPQTRSECMTPEQAANPTGNMMNPGGQAGSCNFTQNTFSGGTINVQGTCTAPGRGTAEMRLTGTFTATTMTAQVNTTVRAPAGTQGPQEVRMTGTLNGRRTGDCAGGARPGNSQ
jgi:hypothetical protein